MTTTETAPVLPFPVTRGFAGGTVVQDRWGLRWRADIAVPSGRKGWLCRSAQLRKWLTDEQLADRGPLTVIRVDRVFAERGNAAVRQAGEAEDAAATFDLPEDDEDDDRWVRGTQ